MPFDCCFEKDNNRFRYRAGAIIIENGCVLFATNSHVDYFYSIGGGVHINETAEDAVKREVFEETGVHYETERLAVIHENFYIGDDITCQGVHCHEISFYYLMKPRGTQELKSDSYTWGVKENMEWIPIDKLDKHKVFPSFIKEYLSAPHDDIVHIVTDERNK